MLVLTPDAGERLEEWLCAHRDSAHEWVAGHVAICGLKEYDLHLTVRTIGLVLRKSVITDAAVFVIDSRSLLILLRRPDLSALQQMTAVFCAAMGLVPCISNYATKTPDHIMLGRLSDSVTWHELERLALGGGWRGPPIIYGFDEAVERIRRLSSMAGTAFLGFGHRARRMRTNPRALAVSRDHELHSILKHALGPSWQVEKAHSGVCAAEYYVAATPDLVVIDADLPDIDAPRLMAALTRLDGNCLIFGTRDDRSGAEDWWREIGARGFLSWPPGPQTIRELGKLAIADIVAQIPPPQRAHAGGQA